MANENSLRARYPDLYVKDANIDRHTCRRVVPMEVLSLGMPRTGTTSLKAALQILGYNECYHMFNTYHNIRDFDMWVEALAAKYDGQGKFGRTEFDKLLGHCMAVTDAPCSLFAPELIDAYPEAKVILVEREIEAWYKSFSIIMDNSFVPAGVARIVAFLDPLWTGRRTKFFRAWMEKEFGANTAEEVREVARDRYRAHYAEIRRITPKERLLEYELGSGWEPLCKFLGKPVPDVPFPRANEAAELKEKMTVLRKKGLRRAVQNAAAGLFICVVVAFGLYYS
ncbi:P-loop containing nucleoside triphosphate hydrolase protein [Roridomyces roridus]|uniref:P-loop containing nucleoside triphosphate hydrolase protein n=1 Tax=Roridomyces roridus TaxID=1738132 RepID=A0AAD7B0L2_9AGAR|nr:P-loop containing nucleoside triphosphate hydrolase protein [Roridomyces roridus]KAJ7640984.1 P-loop containing nucleoside triphosphate hydrolase protein [Roridomyces roridus]